MVLSTYLRVGDGLAAFILVDNLRLFIDHLRKLRLSELLRYPGLLDLLFELTANTFMLKDLSLIF